MRALIMSEPCNGPRCTTVQTVSVPRPGPGEVAIDVAFAGINFIDVMARRGDAGYVPQWPYVPGLEVAGTVREVGDHVTTLEVGDRVSALTIHGGLAEVAVARAELTLSVPDTLPLDVVAAAPAGLATPVLLLTESARLRAGESVLVHSASGGIGQAIAQIAAALGAGPLVGTVGRPEKAEVATGAGYTAAFSRGQDLPDEVRAATGGRGADVILDPLGTTMLETDLAAAAPGARIVLFGNASGAAAAPLPPLAASSAGTSAWSDFPFAASLPGHLAGSRPQSDTHSTSSMREASLRKSPNSRPSKR